MLIGVTGGRDFNDKDLIHKILYEYSLKHKGDLCFVSGSAPGADFLVESWCEAYAIPCLTMKAYWKAFGRPAGPIRNGWIIKYCDLDLLLAFPGGHGTANMIQQAKAKSIPIRNIAEEIKHAND